MGEDRSQTSRRVTVAEAARILDTTGEAIRSRIKRGTLESTKEGATVYVLLGADQTPPKPQPGDDQTTDQTRPDAREELVEELRDRARFLENQLEAERQAHAEARRLLMAALERIPPQLEPPREAPGAPAETAEGSEPTTSGGGSQEATERPWWRRMFGG